MSTIKVTDATVEPLTLADAKAHLRETLVDAGNDAYISALITVARTEAENRLQRSLLQTTWLTTLDRFPHDTRISPWALCARPIELPNPPVISVDWVKYLDAAGAQQTLDPAAYVVRTTESPGQIVRAYGSSWPATLPQPGAVQVQYKAGYGTTADKVPAPIVQWIKLALSDLYENRSRSSERPMLEQGFACGLLDAYRLWSV